MKPVVFIKIPKSGLGNCLLVWAHALVFAQMNGMELISGRWKRFRWGAIIRGEKKNRRYAGYFHETSYLKLIKLKLLIVFSKREIDPEIKQIGPTRRKKVYVFTKGTPDDDLFKHLIMYEELIRRELYNLLTPVLKKKYQQCKSPEIAIHVRRGDFKIANPVTPNQFFIDAIHNIREAFNAELPVTIFTDAADSEIEDILAMNGVAVSQNEEDILDILQMSKSKFLVLSRSSTFSYWAAFLSRATVIMSDDDWQREIKPCGNGYLELRRNGSSSNLDLIKEIKQKMCDEVMIKNRRL